MPLSRYTAMAARWSISGAATAMACTQAPWEQDTIVNVFSTTKGVASLAVAVAASRGLIDYDAKSPTSWPSGRKTGMRVKS